MTPEQLADLHARSFTTPRPWSAQEFADLLNSPLVFVTGNAKAFAMGRVIADEAELLTIATDPNHRRKGLGLACLCAFEDKARASGALTAFLEVSANNTAALALYQARGFTQVGLRKAYYQSPRDGAIDAVVMNKAL